MVDEEPDRGRAIVWIWRLRGFVGGIATTGRKPGGRGTWPGRYRTSRAGRDAADC
ncbi:hypothetical protein [Saccharopolyspora shandongensis]|uniref:hypothetical protein n=1 Tax=Saccharopolyspora shandongensis TaxID=418495 RepID=UPI00340BB5BA